MSRPIGPTCALYVPGDRPDRFGKATAAGADLVVLDLEDGVGIAAKPAAREAIRKFLLEPGAELSRGSVQLAIRINAVDSPFFDDDLALLTRIAAADRPLAEVRLPKVETRQDVRRLTEQVPFPVAALIESAAGLVAAEDIAGAPGLVSLGLGESDLRSDLRLDGEDGLNYPRARVVVACAAVGLRPPAMAAYPQIRDLDGLERSCRVGRALGCHGRSAIHPTQIAVIRRAFRPSEVDIAWAREVLATLDSESGAVRGSDGAMVDAAMRRRAESILDLVEG